MRALVLASVLALAPGLAGAARVVTPAGPQRARTNTGAPTAVAPVRLSPGAMPLGNASLTGTLGPLLTVPGLNFVSPNVQFRPNEVPQLAPSAVELGAQQAGAFLEQSALQRRVPPEPPALSGATYKPMAQQSAALSERGSAVSVELEAARRRPGGVEDAQALGDRVWEALLGAGSNAASRAELSAASAARPAAVVSYRPLSQSEVRAAASRGSLGRAFAARPAPLPGTAAVELIAPWASVGLAPVPRAENVSRVVMRVYGGALALSYASLPGHAPSRRLAGAVTVSLLPAPKPASAALAGSRFAARPSAPRPAMTGAVRFVGVSVAAARPSPAALLKAGADLDRFTYLQSAGQSLAEVPAPASSAQAEPSAVPVLPLWAFPASALLPLLALALFVQRES